MRAIKRDADGKYNRLLDQLQILEYIETNNRPLTPREHEMRRDYLKQADVLKAKGHTYGGNQGKTTELIPITRTSILSGKVRTIELAVTHKQLIAYCQDRKLLKDTFPNLTPEEIEFFRTGSTVDEWDDTLEEWQKFIARPTLDDDDNDDQYHEDEPSA